MKNYNLKKIKEIQDKIMSNQDVKIADFEYYQEWQKTHSRKKRELTELEEDVHRAEEIEHDLNFSSKDELEWKD
jgi:hypothetical protein